MRGRRGRDRRIAEQVARDFAGRHASAGEDRPDFDVAAVDAEVADVRRAAERAAGSGRAARTRPT
nr:hypothetical protein [Chloroflexota bacterium]